MKGQHVTLQPRWLYSVIDERSYIGINFKYTTDEFNVFFHHGGLFIYLWMILHVLASSILELWLC